MTALEPTSAPPGAMILQFVPRDAEPTPPTARCLAAETLTEAVRLAETATGHGGHALPDTPLPEYDNIRATRAFTDQMAIAQTALEAASAVLAKYGTDNPPARWSTDNLCPNCLAPVDLVHDQDTNTSSPRCSDGCTPGSGAAASPGADQRIRGSSTPSSPHSLPNRPIPLIAVSASAGPAQEMELAMPYNMSVALTENQVRSREKSVTRRMGWEYLKPGTRLTLCRKVMGRRAGEPLVRIVDVEVVSVRRERLDLITAEDTAAEGFPDMTPTEFIDFFCRTHRGCRPDSEVTRIEWRYLD